MTSKSVFDEEGLVAGRWGCFNCIYHGNRFASPPGYTICRAPRIIQVWERAVRFARDKFGEAYRALPSWCWRDRCVVCREARVPYRETYCYQCHMNEQWDDYNSMISEGIWASLYGR